MTIQITLKMSAVEFDDLREAVRLGRTRCEILAQEAQDEDLSGASVWVSVAIPFHALATIYAVYRNTDGSAVWNSAAADDEMLDINIWFRRDS